MANCVWTIYNVLDSVSISYKIQHPEGGNYQSTSQVRKLRLREAKKLAQGHGGKSQENLYREQPEGTFCMCVCGSRASSPQRKTLTPTPKAPPASGRAGMGRLGEPGTCLSNSVGLRSAVPGAGSSSSSFMDSQTQIKTLGKPPLYFRKSRPLYPFTTE